MTNPTDNTPSARDAASVGRGTNQGGMRESNERVVLTLLRRQSDMAKADIARSTGLSAQTVARLIGSLEADGLIVRGTPQKGRIGQPSVPLSLNPDGAVFLGMKVGRRSVEMIATDFMGQIIGREKEIYDYPDFDAVLRFATQTAAALKAHLPAPLRTRIAGMGIAMPFFLWSWAEQIGVDQSQMADWQHRDLQAEVATALDLPVFLQNDATSACSAELVFGTHPLPRNALCFYIAFFVGGGLVLNNALFTGTTGNAAGLGPLHVPDQAGVPRPLIELASLATLEAAMEARGQARRKMWDTPERWDVPQDLLNTWVDSCAPALAHAIRSVQTILDLEMVLIDGWLPRDLCLTVTQRVQRELAAFSMTGMHRPEVRHGSLGADARVLGAASLPLSRRFLV
ncbi:ROK family transcriptional regulator [Jannaschia sp. CCS1]|uniref:ROK family transcriptional regulator n=1 Tax=Jannaschia sp. (strain CCS1) TaxID=290400 RepID=UPI000053D6BC|nr:ROK family transcriptional regulator [Jannaschia sp. CCS1]ABD54289.1 ROK [Jannaschia sp. CCS1]